jgi:hypothetical protein
MRKTILFALALVALMFAAIGCDKYSTTGEKTETATVVTLSYTPKATGSGTAIGPTFTGGKLGISISSVSVTTPEVWGVILRCSDHKKTFCLNSKAMFEQVKPGDVVQLIYVDDIVTLEATGETKIRDSHTRRFIVPVRDEVAMAEALETGPEASSPHADKQGSPGIPQHDPVRGN